MKRGTMPANTNDRLNRGKTEFYGICKAAMRLQVSRYHLYKVLKGDRKSRSLLARYAELQKSKENQ